jgi:hypothetical protein
LIFSHSAVSPLIFREKFVCSLLEDGNECKRVPAKINPVLHTGCTEILCLGKGNTLWQNAILGERFANSHTTTDSKRHTKVHHLAGAVIPDLMKWLGDSSIASIQRYLHDTNRAAEVTNNMVFPARLRAVA